jgi:hypothetical protein
MTPGAYIRRRREAAGLSIGDVMAVLAGGGVLSAPLEEIEADRARPSGMDAALLAYAFRLDDMTVARLKDGEPVQLCTSCGCSEGYECDHEHFGRCELIRDRCSVCRHAELVKARAA